MTSGYSRSQIWLHWSVVVMLVVAYATSDIMKAAFRAATQGGSYSTPILHIGAGLTVLVLVAARLWLRLRRGPVPAPDSTPAWVRLISNLVHAALYLLLILLPATGAAAWFLDIHTAGDMHEVLFNLGMLLVGLHVAAALYHQFVRNDGLLLRMLRPATTVSGPARPDTSQ
jgi:cytochrome b561